MNRRILLIMAAISATIILLSPFIYHKLKFDRRYEANQNLWYRVSKGNYDAVVLSNTLEYPIGGKNEISVRNGQLIHGVNTNCETCTLVDYLPLTIETLFDRIYDECIRGRFLPTCNIVYENNLGYPARIDTYTFSEDGVHAPSITIPQVRLIE